MKNNNLTAAPNGYKKVVILLITVILFFISATTTINAQAALSIGTAPVSEKLTLAPGRTYNGEIVVWNLSQTTTKYRVVVRGFKQIENQPGTAIILTEEEEARTLYSASKWINISRNEITLIPNKNEKIYYRIDVPEGITKGEYVAMIAFISEAENKSLGTATFTTLSSGTPILIKVGEDFVENAELLKFQTDKNFYETPSIRFLTRIKNLGDTHISPVGEIVLTNIFDKEIARIPFNPNFQSILRGNNGEYSMDWNYGSFITKDKQIVLGPIKANLIVTYRNFQPGFSPLVAETSFWIIPWKYILLILLTIITIVILWKLRNRKKSQPQVLPK
ncbi:MAG: hypothetical protein AB9915_03985 [Candidatus Dojkabacteria bacterium]